MESVASSEVIAADGQMVHIREGRQVSLLMDYDINTVGIPTLQLVLFGYAINLDVRNVPTAVLDRSHSAISRKLVGELQATQTFRIASRAGPARDPQVRMVNCGSGPAPLPVSISAQ